MYVKISDWYIHVYTCIMYTCIYMIHEALLVEQKLGLDNGTPATLLSISISCFSALGRYAVEPVSGYDNNHYLSCVLHGEGEGRVVARGSCTPPPPACGVQRANAEIILLPGDQLVYGPLQRGRFALDGNRRWINGAFRPDLRFPIQLLILNLVFSHSRVVWLTPAGMDEALDDRDLELCRLHSSTHHTKVGDVLRESWVDVEGDVAHGNRTLVDQHVFFIRELALHRGNDLLRL